MKKKILFVITKSNFGGAQRYVYDLATQLPKDGYEVVVAFGGSGLLKEKLEQDGIRTRTIASFERDINFNKEVRAFFELKKIIREEQPHIVHLNSSKAGGIGALAARIMCVPKIVFTAHGWAFQEKKNLLWKTSVWLLSFITSILSHTVIVVSENDLKAARLFGLKHTFKKIYPALPTFELFSKEIARDSLFQMSTANKRCDDLWLVTNAELTHNKNLFAAIDAVVDYNQTATQKIFYSIIGEGELKNALEKHIQKLNANSYISLLGYVNDARSYMNAFDIFLLPSKKEGMPYVLLEAGVAGLPTIASNVGGIPEIIESGKNGLLIDPFSHTTIVNAFQKLASSRSEREAFGRALQQEIDTRFALSEMVQKTDMIYSS